MQTDQLEQFSVGKLLREARIKRGYTQAEAAQAAGITAAWVSYIERGSRHVSPDIIAKLCQHYKIPKKETKQLLASLPDRTYTPKGKQAITNHLWLDYYRLEQIATRIDTYQAQVVPGLLQIPAYTQAIADAAETEPGAEKVIELRLRRKERLEGESPIVVNAILDESVLFRLIGGYAVMADQLDYLAEISERSNVTVTILPYVIGAHIALTGSFRILYMPPELGHKIVYLEHDRSGTRLAGDADLERYTLMAQRLEQYALTAQDSRERIRSLAALYRQEITASHATDAPRIDRALA